MKYPTVDKHATIMAAKYNAAVAALFAESASFFPKNLAITAEVPMPKPIVKLSTVKVTGNVKLIAAKGCVPSSPTKKVSTKLNVINKTIP